MREKKERDETGSDDSWSRNHRPLCRQEARLKGIPVRVLDSRSSGTSCTHVPQVLKAPEHRRSPILICVTKLGGVAVG